MTESTLRNWPATDERGPFDCCLDDERAVCGKGGLIVSAHLLILFFMALVWLPRYEARMFAGLDGGYMQMLVAEQWVWMPWGMDLGLNIF